MATLYANTKKNKINHREHGEHREKKAEITISGHLFLPK